MRTAIYKIEVNLPDHITQELFRQTLEHALQKCKLKNGKVTILRNFRHNHHSAKTAQRNHQKMKG